MLEEARRLADQDLVARVRNLAGRKRHATALLVAHLAVMDERELHVAAGYSSLFRYCHEALGLSEHGAYHRIEVARAARRFPLVLQLLVAGEVNLTTVRVSPLPPAQRLGGPCVLRGLQPGARPEASPSWLTSAVASRDLACRPALRAGLILGAPCASSPPS